MKKIRNNKKGFTLVELLAVIVVLAIVMGIAAVAITNVLDSTRKNAFVASARSYIAGAKTLVNTSEMDVLLGGTSTYAPICNSSTNATIYIPLSAIRTENNTDDTSPYGNKYVKAITGGTTPPSTGSYVKVVATPIGGGSTDCNNVFSIYLTDGVYHIPETAESALDGSKVALVS